MKTDQYICHSCGTVYPLDRNLFRCSCGGFLTLEHPGIPDPDRLADRDMTIWRYRESFGLPEGAEPLSLGEGRTPLVPKRVNDRDLLFKLDYLQPSGSFKDRGASVLLTLARWAGARDVVEDSSGNAGAAISAYSAAAGIRCRIFTPHYTPEGKLVQIRLYGSEVVRVPGMRQDANNAAVAAAETSWYASHLWNPFFVMGLQSAAFEIWEQLGRDVPDTVILPLGSGGYLEGLFMGFSALRDAGLTDRIPRLVGVQAEHCAPLHEAWRQGLGNFVPIEPKSTIAEGIAVSHPPRAAAVLDAVRESGGYTIAVSDDEIRDAERMLFSLGLFPEPTSASTLAGWLRAGDRSGGRTVLILTGHGLKETAKLEQLFPAEGER